MDKKGKTKKKTSPIKTSPKKLNTTRRNLPDDMLREIASFVPVKLLSDYTSDELIRELTRRDFVGKWYNRDEYIRMYNSLKDEDEELEGSSINIDDGWVIFKERFSTEDHIDNMAWETTDEIYRE